MKRPSLSEMMTQLINSPSISSVSPEWDSSNKSVIDLLADWCENLGFDVQRLAIPGHPGKYNLVASLGRGPEGLVLSGHTDTVPCDEALWRSDPFNLSERDGRWYGLGSCDMKGFFAVALDAISRIDLHKLNRPLILVATADEESSMSGARALVETHQQLGRHALIGEPTGLKPVRMHKGILMDAVRVVGQAGHSSDPALGNSALEGMHQVLGEILAWRQELQARFRNPLFAVEVPTLNLGHICGGDNPNRICGACELSFDLRPLPGMDIASLRAELDQRLDQRLAETGLRVERHTLFEGVPAMETPAGSPIVAAAEQLTGVTAGTVAFATEGPYLNQIGHETVILGPGHIDQAHQPDEFLAIDQVAPAQHIIQSLVHKFCVNA